MNKYLLSKVYSLLAAFIIPSIFVGSTSIAADDHSYQVTGPVLAVTDTYVTVQKGHTPWVIIKDIHTKTAGDIKVGTKVAIKYHMVADTVATKTLSKK